MCRCLVCLVCVVCMLHAPKAADELDAEGWSPLHHAVNACSWSWRAMKAALALVPLTPKEIINHPTTRSQPEGFTCLHFASEGSDKDYERARLVRALVERQANVEARTTTGNTPLLLASGTGVVDTIVQLLDCGADVNAKKQSRPGGLSKRAPVFQICQNGAESVWCLGAESLGAQRFTALWRV